MNELKPRPFCGSNRIVETLKGDTSICLACESLLNDKNKPTVFNRITASLEVLAAKEVLQYVLGIGFKVISEHKGEWSNSEVEHLITDLNQLTMEKFYERGFIARIKDDEK